jgi:hypothetical protein
MSGKQLLTETDEKEPSTIGDAPEELFAVPGEEHTAHEELGDSLSGSKQQ